MYSIFAAYIILIVYYAITESRRKGQAAATLTGGPFGHASTRLMSLAVAISITLVIVANALNYLQIGVMADLIGWIGVVVMLFGTTLRVWASQTLGRLYTRTLHISAGQHVVQEGPYKYVRHPGYLGVILLWVGAGLATVNWIVAALVTLTFVAAHRYRINAEARMLVASFAEQYTAYAEQTWRLLPFIWESTRNYRVPADRSASSIIASTHLSDLREHILEPSKDALPRYHCCTDLAVLFCAFVSREQHKFLRTRERVIELLRFTGE